MYNIIDELFKLQDKKYRDFQCKLIPTINSNTIIGVRTPELREYAKRVFESENRDSFLNNLPHKYYEENLIHFFVISMIKDFDECIQRVEEFLPYVDCWPASDQATPKVFKKNHKKLLPYIEKWIFSKHIYTVRFGIRMLMNEFLDDDFKEEYLEWVSNIKSKEYYVNKMVAWYFATALSKKYNETISYFEKHKLNEWVHKKAIQKATESYRITKEQKEYLRGLK